MAFKRSTSPGRHSLLADVLRLIAEPVSTNQKKKPEIYFFQSSSKVTNHNYCDICLGGGEIVCCDKCPKSYHIKCHSPSMNKLPDGEWLCKECTVSENGKKNSEIPIDDNIDIKTFLRKQFEAINSYCMAEEEFLSEIPIQRKYNVKIPSRKQLDKMKMTRKADRCVVCKRGVLRGRLMQCSYCFKLYHLNCLDPPIRDWDHSMKFQCPIHKTFFELVYPDIFTPDCGVRSDAVTMKRQRCELTSQPVNTYFNVPSHIDAMYKKPEVNIPTTNEKSSLNILCDVASIALESINSNHSTHSDINISNDISAKFLAHQRLNKSQKNNCLLHERPTASLSCLSKPINISTVHKSSFTIGKHRNNDLCLLPYGNCEYISDYHAVISFDSKLGDFLVKNRSRYGIIVDNVSYFGSRRPKEVSNSELKEINSQVKRHINKRRRVIQNRRMLHIYHHVESEKVIIKYAEKKRKFDYRLMSKYYSNKFKNVKHSYRKIQCKCSKRVIPKDGYAGHAVLRNKSIMSIGCMRFKFTYSTEEVPKVCAEKCKVYAKKVSRACVEFPKVGVDVPNIFVEENSKVCMKTNPNVCTEKIFEGSEEIPNAYMVEDSDVHEDVSKVYLEDSNRNTEENLSVVLAKQDKALHTSEQQPQNGPHRNCLFEITTTFSSLINRCESLEEQHVLKQMYLDSISEFEFSDSHLEINDVPNDNINMGEDDNNIQSLDKDDNCEQTLESVSNIVLDDSGNPTLNNDGDLALNVDVDPTLNDGGDPTLNNVHISDSTNVAESHEQIPVSGEQSCFVNDLVQEVDESFSDSCEIVEEEVLFEFDYNSAAEHVVDNVQSWIEEVDVEVEGNSVDQEPRLLANYNTHGDYKTEHLYCARSPTDPIPTIIISSDDDDDDNGE